MAKADDRVRAAAQELHDAIVDARKEGFRVNLPSLLEQLPAIAVSAGSNALTPEEIGEAAKAEAERQQRAKNTERAAAVPVARPAAPRATTPVVRTEADKA